MKLHRRCLLVVLITLFFLLPANICIAESAWSNWGSVDRVWVDEVVWIKSTVDLPNGTTWAKILPSHINYHVMYATALSAKIQSLEIRFYFPDTTDDVVTKIDIR
jgi:hypothetical protein